MSESREQVITVGIAMPDDFPVKPYNAIHRHWQQKGRVDNEYSGGWNAVAYRFRGMAEHDEAFTASISKPLHEDRYVQERELFCFFVEGLAVIETFCYSLYFLASIAKPAEFPTSKPRSVTVDSTTDKFGKTFPAEKISNDLAAISTDAAYLAWRDTRNCLAHRTAPGRVIYGSSHGPPPPDEWKLGGIVLDNKTTASRREWMANRLAQLLEDASSFVTANV